MENSIMHWAQEINPLNNVALSALVAIIPMAFLFWALIIRKMKGYVASLYATGIALLIAIFVYGMPSGLAFLSLGQGALYGLFPICWIVITAVFLFNVTVSGGQFDVIRFFLASITDDRRIQALIIAFSFGSFLEGTAGFGAPVAITSAMLVGIGFNPLYAAGICLIANTAPVAFGSIGTPITVASQISGIPEMAISQMVGRTLPILSLFVPWYLVILMAGFKKSLEVLPAILVSGGTFALLQWFCSNYLGPMLPDVLSGIGSIICLVIFLRFWKPKTIWRFRDEPLPAGNAGVHYSTGQIFRAWSPFIILSFMMIGWGLQPVKELLNHWGQLQFAIPGLDGHIFSAEGLPLPHIFTFNYLSAAGTAILISALIAMPLLGIGFRQGLSILGSTLRQLKFSIMTVCTVLGFAYLVNDSGITISAANALAATGWLFPFFAPMLGWLGVFITGSDTSANALFGKMQAATASSIGVDPVVAVGANVSGGVVGKMISPQSIAVAAGAGGLIGRESELFRFTVKHSFIMLFFISLLVLAQAYLFSWLVPAYTVIHAQGAKMPAENVHGYLFLALLALVIALIVVLVLSLSGKRKVLNRK